MLFLNLFLRASIVIAPGSQRTLCAIGPLTLDEMEPHRERSIAENRAPRWHARRLFRKLTGAKAKVP